MNSRQRIIDHAASPIAALRLRAVFDADRPCTIGIEEELMLLDPRTLDLAPCAPAVLDATGGDERFKLELVAAQIEAVTPPKRTVGAAATAMRGARRDLSAALNGEALAAGAGTHPFAAALGELNVGSRYARLGEEFASVARRQLVFGLHVHVAIRGAERAVAVHDALRSHLPEIAALGANSPFHDGTDSGLASVRPTISVALPRQGVPPALGSWADYAAALSWGARAGALPDMRRWWWELRLHPVFGTIEVRVADTQTSVREAAAIAALIHALAATLSDRFDAGEPLAPAPSWRIAENRWWAARHGLQARLADLHSGERRPVRERLHALLDDVSDAAQRLGCTAELDDARTVVDGPGGAVRQRQVAQRRGLRAVPGWLAEQFLAD